MSTRLDKLLAILQNGSFNASTKKAAASQIGEICKAHPSSYMSLINRIYPLLIESEWDTRVSAGNTLKEILSVVGKWQPNKDFSDHEVVANLHSEIDKDMMGLLKLGEFDIKRVMEKGKPLLASGGQEYDEYLNMMENLPPLERIAVQRKNIRERLGYSESSGNVEERDVFIGEEVEQLVEDNDLIIEKKQQEEDKAREAEKIIEELKHVTPRERNRMKRKQKESIREKTKKRKLTLEIPGESAEKKRAFQMELTPQPQTVDKVVVEHVEDSFKSVLDSEARWPFHYLSVELLIDMYSENWYVRHGASIGLRELFTTHIESAGMFSGFSDAENEANHTRTLEDFAIRIICVFVLDRYGDFSSDSYVAPVREMAAQALGALFRHIPESSLTKIIRLLVEVIPSSVWEVRHGYMLLIKYFVAMREDVFAKLLHDVVPIITLGLRDEDDYVRSVAAESLLSINPRILEPVLIDLIAALYAALQNCDELSASTASVMPFLSRLHTSFSLKEEDIGYIFQVSASASNEGAESVTLEMGSSSSYLASLVSRIFPFFRNIISTVRLSSMETVNQLINSESSSLWLPECLGLLLRLIFQNFILEERKDVLKVTTLCLRSLLSTLSPKERGEGLNTILKETIQTYFDDWISMLTTAHKEPLSRALLISGELTDEKGGRRRVPNSSVQEIDLNLYFFQRLKACSALGMMMSNLGVTESRNVLQKLLALLKQNSGIAILVSSTVLSFWAKFGMADELKQEAAVHVTSKLGSTSSPNFQWTELAESLRKIELQYKAYTNSINGAYFDELLKRISFDRTYEMARAVVTMDIPSEYLNEPSKSLTKKQALLSSITYHQSLQSSLEVSSNASLACSMVFMGSIPNKVNIVVRGIMNSTKWEENDSLQKYAAKAVARITEQLATRRPSPNPKIFNNICGYICSDRKNETSLLIEKEEKDIIEILYMKRIPATASEKSAAITRRGGMFALRALCRRFGDDFLREDLCLALWDIAMNPLEGKAKYQWRKDDETNQVIVDSFATLTLLSESTASAVVHGRLRETIEKYVPDYIKHPNVYVRQGCGYLMASMSIVSRGWAGRTIGFIVSDLYAFLDDLENADGRMGVTQSLYTLTIRMGVEIVPFLPFLLLPVLARMSDYDSNCRKVAALCFSSLIRYLPLYSSDSSIEARVAKEGGEVQESAVAQPANPILLDMANGEPDKIEKLRIIRENELLFIDQLLDSKKAALYAVKVPIKGELRRYQQEGVNWLAFLNRYNLNGILCDDMGLGKTLQALCIVASDIVDLRTASPDMPVFPTLIVCPSTIVSHWYYEVKKFFADANLSALMYYGPNRDALISSFRKHDIVVLSYELLRKDIAKLAEIQFNYFILDEGHIVKNSKSKMSKSAKRIRCKHKLVLTGTPIQNNVLELWNLFDLLMPGFLGTERQFNEKYAKPVNQSRDSRNIEKRMEDAEEALESLHKMVLPFVLRRMKEDVLTDLPPKIIQDLYCDLSPLQTMLYSEFSSQGVVQKDLSVTESVKAETATHVFQSLHYLRKLCSHPSLVLSPEHPQYEEVREEARNSKLPLSVYLKELHHAPKLLSLKEILLECGIGLTSGIAQVAQTPIPTVDINPSTPSRNNTSGGGGDEVASRHRVLIFCQLKSMLDIIEVDFFKRYFPSVTYRRLDGSTSPHLRHKVVNEFNADPTIDVLLLTTKVGGLGLNLTGADTVIFYEHDWNPMKDLQAMDRAHRIGQKNVVNVYRLITRGTLEEKIMSLQQFKLHVAGVVITQQNVSMKSMDTDQILDLFSLSSSKADEELKSRNQQEIDRSEEEAATKKVNTKYGKIMEEVGELWDENQYAEEYSLDNFMKRFSRMK